MHKSIIRAVAIAGTAVAIMLFAPVAPIATAETPDTIVLAKGDRLVTAVKGSPCAQRAWPNYEQGCLFDKRRPADEVRKISMVNLDRQELSSVAAVLNTASR
jgi:hypothetical protein